MHLNAKIQCILSLWIIKLGNISKTIVVWLFFSELIFWKKNQECHQCQTVRIQIRPDVFSARICVPTICKGNQQTILVGKKKLTQFRSATHKNKIHCILCNGLCIDTQTNRRKFTFLQNKSFELLNWDNTTYTRSYLYMSIQILHGN